jgi:hypothetical protein
MTTRNEKLQLRKKKQLARQLQTADVLYRMERDAVLRGLDPEKLMAHFVRWKRPIPKFWGKVDAPLAIMHRARLELANNFSKEECMASALWLIAHQYQLPAGMELKDGILTRQV